MGIWEINPFELLLKGGPIMWPILLCSVIAASVIIEKWLYFRSIETDTPRLKRDIIDLVKQDRLKDAAELCDQNPSPIAKVIKAGILKYGSTKEDIKIAMEEVLEFEIPKLEQRLNTLATIAQVSTLLGFLGTVTGLCGSFITIEQRSNTLSPVSPADVSSGVWEALLTTAAGLIVAIPAFLAHNYFASRCQYLVLDMEKAASDILNLMCRLAEVEAENQ